MGSAEWPVRLSIKPSRQLHTWRPRRSRTYGFWTTQHERTTIHFDLPADCVLLEATRHSYYNFAAAQFAWVIRARCLARENDQQGIRARRNYNIQDSIVEILAGLADCERGPRLVLLVLLPRESASRLLTPKPLGSEVWSPLVNFTVRRC